MPNNPQNKHPRGLYVLYNTEAWERFSYYGVRAILVLYLCAAVSNSEGHPGLGFTEADALALYGIYTGLVYLTPLFGGFLSDNVLGARKSVLIGGTLLALGDLCMLFPALLYPALSLLIIGNGFFKPNITNMVGGLYEEDDPRRDGGYTIFYMGINIGSFLASLVCGILASKFGYRWGFCAAFIAMVVAQFVFGMGLKHLGKTGFPPDMTEVTPETKLRRSDWMDIIGYVFSMSMIVFIAFAIASLLFPTTPTACPLIAIALFVLMSIWRFCSFNSRFKTAKDETKRDQTSNASASNEPQTFGFTTEEWQRIGAILILSGFVVFFWVGFEQVGGTMTLFAEQCTERELSSGFTIPAAWFQSINPLLICALAPLFSMLWYAWDNSKYKISTPYKMALGLFFLSLGFMAMYAADSYVITDAQGNVTQRVGPQWLVIVYFLHTIGELCLSPVGLSMVTKLAPARVMSLMMGVWFLSSAVANYIAGTLGTVLANYHINLWYFLICTPAGAGVLLLLLSPMIKKWMHGRG